MSVTHAFVNPQTDSADTTIARPSDWNADHVGNNIGWYNVQDHGATGDGVTNDTAALQAAFALLSTTVYDLYIPQGTYLISGTLDIPLTTGRRIHGAGRGVSIIRQITSNIPVIRATNENTHSIILEDLSLTYLTAQVKTNTSAVALSFNFTSGNGSGCYYWTVRRIRITNCANGIKLEGTGQLAIWNMYFDDIWFSTISRCAINIAGGGMPNNLFHNIKIINTNTGITDGTSAVFLSACGATFDGLDIEGWYGNAISVAGGADVAFRAVHIEWHVFDTDNEDAISIANGPVKIDNGTISFSGTSAVVECRLIKIQDSTSSLILNGFQSVVTGSIAGSGKVRGIGGVAGSRAWLTGCKWTAATNFTEVLPAASGTDGFLRVTEDGMPPVVDALPTPSVTYRGRRFRVLGGTGVADVVSECSKDGNDAYVWVTK